MPNDPNTPAPTRIWCDDLPADRTWATLWNGYITCSTCRGIRRVEHACAGCGSAPIKAEELTVALPDGRKVRMPPVFAGAEGRYEDWLYLQLMEREWKRPVIETASGASESAPKCSPRAALVLLFWAYFETRIDRLLKSSLESAAVPEGLAEDALARHSAIGTRLYKLYPLLFGVTYFDDLTAIGFADVAKHLRDVHERRNAFAHGHPEAIDDELVARLVAFLRREHESWIAAFNKRALRHRDR